MQNKIIEIEKGLFLFINCKKHEFKEYYKKWKKEKRNKINDLFKYIMAIYDERIK